MQEIKYYLSNPRSGLDVVTGISSVLGLAALMVWAYYLLEAKRIIRSITDLICGEGPFNAKQIEKMLIHFKSDEARLEYIKTVAKYSSENAEKYLQKVEANIDVLSLARINDNSKRSLGVALIFAVIAVGAISHNALDKLKPITPPPPVVPDTPKPEPSVPPPTPTAPFKPTASIEKPSIKPPWSAELNDEISFVCKRGEEHSQQIFCKSIGIVSVNSQACLTGSVADSIRTGHCIRSDGQVDPPKDDDDKLNYDLVKNKPDPNNPEDYKMYCIKNKIKIGGLLNCKSVSDPLCRSRDGLKAWCASQN